jgi:hypothetical protein
MAPSAARAVIHPLRAWSWQLGRGEDGISIIIDLGASLSGGVPIIFAD